jgi:histidine triad (HIT) family protein
MYNNAPEGYKCPICIAVNGAENNDTWIVQDDIFYRDDLVVGFISSKAIKGNDGHPLIVPVDHYENLYEIPNEVAQRVIQVSKKVAIALKKTRKADGVSVMQFNEPAGGQHAFHYHMHVIPRFDGDQFETEVWKAEKSDPQTRKEHAVQLRDILNR